MASQPISTHETHLLVEFAQLLLFDHFGDASILDIEPPSSPDVVGRSGRGGAILYADDRSIRATVRLEVWADEPADKPGGAQVFDGTFTVDTGRVILGSLTGSPEDIVIDLDGPGSYSLHAARQGTSTRPDGHQIETWHLMVWPSRPTGRR